MKKISSVQAFWWLEQYFNGRQERQYRGFNEQEKAELQELMLGTVGSLKNFQLKSLIVLQLPHPGKTPLWCIRSQIKDI